jgi:hypothetical protein
VPAQLLYEDGWLDLNSCRCQQLTGDAQRLAINEFGCGRLYVLLVGVAYAEENNRESVGPFLVRMRHDGGFQGTVESLDEAVDCGMPRCCPAMMNST